MRQLLEDFSAAAWAVILLLAVLLVTLGWCAWRADAAKRADIERQAASARALSKNAEARERASIERADDTVLIDNRTKERADAVAPLPDRLPSERRVARACVQLRQQGTPYADLPVSCRSSGGTQAQARQ